MKNALRPFIAALALACACAHAQAPAEALFRSIENGDLDQFSRLVDTGIDLSTNNKLGETPLHWAAMTGTFLAVKALADAGADLNAQDGRTGNTPLHAAVSHDDIVLIHYLISRNVRTDLRNNADLTPLELAQTRGRGSAKLFER